MSRLSRGKLLRAHAVYMSLNKESKVSFYEYLGEDPSGNDDDIHEVTLSESALRRCELLLKEGPHLLTLIKARWVQIDDEKRTRVG